MDVKDPNFKRLLAADIEKAVKNAILSFAEKTIQRIQTEIIPHYPRPPRDKPTYSAAWKSKQIGNVTYVYNNSPHASIIEFGVKAANVKPSRAMVQALKEWVIRKGIANKVPPAPKDTGNNTPKGIEAFNRKQKKHDDANKAVMSTVWGVIAGMRKNGIFNDTSAGASPKGGLRVLEKAFVGWPERLAKEFQDEIKKVQKNTRIK